MQSPLPTTMEELKSTMAPFLVDDADRISESSPTQEDDVLESRILNTTTMTTIAWMSLAILVNLITFAIVSCNPRKRYTRANIYAASFFTAEIVYCLNTLVSNYRTVFLNPITEYEHVIVHGHLFLEFTSRGAMVIALGGVVLDRYRAILDVTSYCPRRQLRISCCYALAGWVIAMICAVPVLAGLTDYWYRTYASLRPFDIYISIHAALFYFIPLLVFSFAYNRLMCRLITCSSRKSLDSFAAKGDKQQRKTRRRLTAGIIATIVVFILSWLLYLAVRVIDGYFSPSEFDPMNMEFLRLVGDLISFLGLSVCPMLVCAVCADYRSLDSQRQCLCCSDNQQFMLKNTEQTWPAAEPNPYYL